MKDEYVKKNVTSVIGTLEFDDEKNKYFVRVENNDEVIEEWVEDILKELVGSQIKIYSEENRV